MTNNTVWICAKCGFSYSPITPGCFNCNTEKNRLENNSSNELARGYDKIMEQIARENAICSLCGGRYNYSDGHNCKSM